MKEMKNKKKLKFFDNFRLTAKSLSSMRSEEKMETWEITEKKRRKGNKRQK
jgi:hypothetical protein